LRLVLYAQPARPLFHPRCPGCHRHVDEAPISLNKSFVPCLPLIPFIFPNVRVWEPFRCPSLAPQPASASRPCRTPNPNPGSEIAWLGTCGVIPYNPSMASIPGHSRIWQANPISGRLSPETDQLLPKYACGPLDNVHPFLTNSKCIDGRHASVVRRRTKSWNLRESKSRNSRDLHLEAIQREKSSRKLSSMPALQLRVSSGDSSIQKLKKRSRSSVLFFGKADHFVDSPCPTSPSDQLPPLYKLDNSSFLDLFQGETRRPPPSSVSKCQRASTMPRLAMRPVESFVRVDDNLCLSPISPVTPNHHPWSPDDAFVNIHEPFADAVTHPPAAARSPSASSRSSDPQDGGPYFSSSASQSSQSSIEEGNTLPGRRRVREASPKYLVQSQEQACDLEVVQTSPKRNYVGRRAFSAILSRDKPLPSEPLVDIRSPFFEIACPAVRAAPRPRFSASDANRADNFRPRPSSSSSKKGRPSLPELSTLSRGERLGLALTLHAQGVKIPHTVRHELAAHLPEAGEQSPGSGNDSPISKLISELETFSSCSSGSSHNAGFPVSQSSTQASSRNVIKSAAAAAHTTDDLDTGSAEMIILTILSLLDIHDLLSAARISKGFYRVFKKHELWLTKSAIFNTCPAAWEYLEEPGKGSQLPATYLESYKIGVDTIASLRTTLLIRCDALLRQETISGLVRADKEMSKRIDQAFWRIWTFCEIFGHKSSRRDSTQAQVDWLKGDRASQTRTSTLSSPKSKRPLSSLELLDISEIWTCLASLLRGFHDQTSEGRDADLFEKCNIDEIHSEEYYIEQWTAHVMTFGLSTIMELSSCSFGDAKASGWTRWLPAAGTIKELPFLTDALASVYQHRLIEEAEAEAEKVAIPRKASGRARSSRKRYTAHGDVLRLQTQNLPRKAVGSPARKPSITLPHPSSSTPPSHHDSCSPIPEGPRSPKVAVTPQQAARRRSAASPTITANMFQALSLQPGASTQIGPTLFPSMPSSPRSASNPTQTRPITPLSSIQSTPIALTRPERVISRLPNLAVSPERPTRAPPAPPVRLATTAVSPIVDPMDKAMDLLVNDMGFPPAAVKDALESCDTGSHFDLDTVIAMLVSASSKPTTVPITTPTVKLVHSTELDSSLVQADPYSQLQTRTPCPEARRSMKKQEKSAYSSQKKFVGFVGGSRSKEHKDAKRRQSKIKAFQVLGVSQERRVSTLVG
jgi:hypothetical protein